MRRRWDILVAGLLLLPALPLCVVIALLVALELREPPIYGSRRVGKDVSLFALLRFRTMRRVAHSAAPPTYELTRVGAIIRGCSLDDLPNLLNVMLGQMSLVGPRPMEPERVDLADPRWRQILSVRPGLVSPAIVRLARSYNASPPAQRQALELAYVARRTPRVDAALLGAALVKLIRSRGNIKARGRPTA